MLIRNRQGWRLLIVLSRLAVAGVLASGLTDFLHPDPVLAQTGPGSPQPPPAAPPDPATDSPAAAPVPPPAPDPAVAVAPGPAAVEPTDAAKQTPNLLPLPPSLERLSAQRNALNQVLCKDRRHHLLLLRAEQALADDDVTTALQNLQAVGDAMHDAFVWPADAVSPRGARTSVDRAIRSLPPQARQTYERLHGGEARSLQSQHATADSPHSLWDLLQNFSHTNAGREVMERELLRAYDAGQFALALQYAERLAVDEHHWSLLNPPIRSLIRRLLDDAGSPDAATPGSSSSPPALHPRWVYSLADGVREQTWSLGNPTIGPAEAAARVSAAINAAAGQWLSERQERRLPTATANQALVAGDLLVVRDFAGVRAIDVRSGELRWRRRAYGGLADVAADHERRGSASPPNFQAHHAGQGPQGQLVADGQRVYFLEDLPADERPADLPDHEVSTAKANRLVALPLYPQDSHIDPDWMHPGPGDDSLAGLCFLGPPLAIDGRLFVLGESDMRLECLALDAGDGRILWRQPIALAPTPVTADTSRLRIACSPVYAASTIVCPTEVGVLVGVDPLTGSLRWVYDHIDEDQRHSAGRWSSSTQRNLGSCELPSRTLVHEGRVFHLPFRSASVHCVDAATGTSVWTAPRRSALGLSALNGENILLIGPRETTSLWPVDGTVRWTTPCPEPAGHGLIAGDAYLLPVADGRCLALSLEDGRPQGARFGRLLHQLAVPEDQPTLSPAEGFQLVSYRPTPAEGEGSLARHAGGNLTAAGDLIAVTTPTGVAVYPLSAPLLDQLESAGGEQTSEEEQLQAAMLHLLLDDRASARTRLQSLLQTCRSPGVRRRGVRLLRELLFAELESAADPNVVLVQLQQLSADEPVALRLLAHRIDVAIQLGEVDALIAALEELQGHSLDAVIDREGDAGYQVNAYDDVADRLALLRDSGTQFPQIELHEYMSTTVAQALQSTDPALRRKVIRLFDGWPQAAPLRNELAAADIATGRLQQAELLLLKNCDAPDRDAAALAHRLLVELYGSAGLQREAAAHLLTLHSEYRNVDVGGGLRGLEFLPDSSAAGIWQLSAAHLLSIPPAREVRIVEHVCGNECGTALECSSARALDHHDRIRRKFVTGEDASLMIIDRGILTADRSHSTLALINRDTGQLSGEIDVPAAYWQLAGGGEGYCGHLLPITGRSAHGLSLLEQRPVWSSQGGEDSQREKVKIGPIGYDYCVLQTSRRLSVIDPATGELRWFRDDLAPDVGLLSSESTGIIGDGQTLTLFDADHVSYTVFRMGSGRIVRRGRLDLSPEDVRRHRRAVGDRLVHLISGQDGDRLRVWDAGSDELLIDLPLHERLYARIADSDQYACISAERELVIVDVAAGRIVLRVPVPANQLTEVSELNVAISPDCYLVNLVGCESGEPQDAVAAMDELELAAMRVQGLLMAVSHDGRVQWSRTVPDAALLTSPHVRWPVLTLLSRVRDPDHRRPATLRAEVLEIRSGETMAVQPDLVRTRFVQADYQHRHRTLKLIGLDSQIAIRLDDPERERQFHAELETADQQTTR
jgi:outer membrane protein assembly factor BamB